MLSQTPQELAPALYESGYECPCGKPTDAPGLCAECALEQAYDTARCPQCNGTDLEYREAPTSFEPHGERFDEGFCECHGCGARFALEVGK